MMTIARVTYRHYNDRSKKPHEYYEGILGYYTTIEKARITVQDFLGKNATVDNDFGFDTWVSPDLPNTEYFIDLINVW